MSRKWLLIILAGILILSLAACNGGSNTPGQTPAVEVGTQAPSEDTDMDSDEGHDEDEDADMNTEDGHDDDSDADDDSADEAVIDAAAIFSARCASCHGAEREGGAGPPLLSANLTKDPSAYVNTITNGSGPMPAWEGRLSADEINAMVEFILSEVE